MKDWRNILGDGGRGRRGDLERPKGLEGPKGPKGMKRLRDWGTKGLRDGKTAGLHDLHDCKTAGLQDCKTSSDLVISYLPFVYLGELVVYVDYLP